MNVENRLTIEKEPFWLLEAVLCLNWVKNLDSDDWLNERSSMNREQKEAFLTPYRKFREAMREHMKPEFEKYPAVLYYIDTSPRQVENLTGNEPPFVSVLHWLQDAVEAKERLDEQTLISTVNNAFEKVLCGELQKAPDIGDPVIRGLEDVMQALQGWDGDDADKFKLIRLYTESTVLFDQLRSLQQESTRWGRQCMSLIQERYDSYMEVIRETDSQRQLLDLIGLGMEEERIRFRIFPTVMVYNGVVMWAEENKSGREEGEASGFVNVYMHVGLDFFYLLNRNQETPYRDELLVQELKALSDPTRIKILHLLAERPCYVQELARELELTPATVSHHLGILVSEDLVTLKVEAGKRRVYYRLAKENLEEVGRKISLLSLSRAEREQKEQTENGQTRKEKKKWTIVE